MRAPRPRGTLGVHVGGGGCGGGDGGRLLPVGRVQQVSLLLLPLPTMAGINGEKSAVADQTFPFSFHSFS